uniref:Uncharacterized protein n=1 Tax=Arundo donax TaxID=35708 RepID=A0A0A9HDK7_ARUDO
MACSVPWDHTSRPQRCTGCVLERCPG